MIATVASAAAAIIVSLPPAQTDAQAAAAYVATCAGGVATPACRQLRRRVEIALLGVLRRQQVAHQRLDRDVLRVAAGATSPELKMFALQEIQNQGSLGPADDPLVIAALDDPSPGVRQAAFGMVSSLADRRYRGWPARRRTANVDPVDPEIAAVLPDRVPDAAALGAPVHPGARFVYFASDASRAWFTSSDPPDRVLAAYARRQGAKTFAGAAELRSGVTATMQALARDPTAPMRALSAPGGGRPLDLAAAMAAMQTATMALSLAGGAANEVANDTSLGGARFVAMELRPVIAGAPPAPAHIVAIAQDRLLGGTAIIVFREPITGARLAAANAAAMDRPNDPEAARARALAAHTVEMKAEPDVIDDQSVPLDK